MRKRALCIVAAVSLCAGCAPSIQEASKLATSGAAEAMSSPANLQRFESIVDAALQEATTRENEGRMRKVAAMFADSAARSALHDFATGSEMRSALSAIAFEVSRQSVLGANEATKELEMEKPKQGFIARTASVLSGAAVPIAAAAFAALLVALLGLTFGLFRTRAEVKRLRVERDHDREPPRPRTGAAVPA